MSFSKVTKRIGAAIVCAWLSSPGPALAQNTQWQVNCLENRVCELKSEILQGENVAARLSIIHIRGHFFLQYTIPLGIELQKGIFIGVDDREQRPTSVTSCTGFGCTGTMNLIKDDIRALEAGNVVRVFYTSPANLDTFAIGFDLSGFTAGFEELTSK